VTVTGTIPYDWPWDGTVVGARLALVVTGDDAGWVARTHDADLVATRIEEIAAAVRAAGGIVVHVDHHDGARTVGTPASIDAPPAATRARSVDDLLVAARGIDAFFASDLDHVLRSCRRDQLALCGFGLETTVHSTMRSANDRGYECLLLTDACAPLDPTVQGAARSMVTMSGGIFGALGTTTALADALAAPTRPAPPGHHPPPATSEVPS
jgi:nicotinamidase-related amidase